eukprot:3135586-Karenia_brevis.AAC.1
MIGFVQDRVSSRPCPADGISDEEAFRALLKGRSGYDDPMTSVAPYKRELVSLPASVDDAPFAAEVADDTIRNQLCNFETQLLRSDEEMKDLQPVLDGIEPYMDVVLRRSRWHYVKFLKDLQRRKILYWSTTPREHCAVFFVKKKDNTLRLIIDCRRTNV